MSENSKDLKEITQQAHLCISVVSNSVCKCGGKFEYKEKEGYVCNRCGWTKLFKN